MPKITEEEYEALKYMIPNIGTSLPHARALTMLEDAVNRIEAEREARRQAAKPKGYLQREIDSCTAKRNSKYYWRSGLCMSPVRPNEIANIFECRILPDIVQTFDNEIESINAHHVFYVEEHNHILSKIIRELKRRICGANAPASGGDKE